MSELKEIPGDYFYNKDEWEVTYSSPGDVIADYGEMADWEGVITIGTLKKAPDYHAFKDDDGVHYFDSLTEALAAYEKNQG